MLSKCSKLHIKMYNSLSYVTCFLQNVTSCLRKYLYTFSIILWIWFLLILIRRNIFFYDSFFLTFFFPSIFYITMSVYLIYFLFVSQDFMEGLSLLTWSGEVSFVQGSVHHVGRGNKLMSLLLSLLKPFVITYSCAAEILVRLFFQEFVLDLICLMYDCEVLRFWLGCQEGI